MFFILLSKENQPIIGISLQDEYDRYMSHLLDTQKPSQHKVLYHHIDSLSENPSTSDKLKEEEKRVENLEKEARLLLEENARYFILYTKEGTDRLKLEKDNRVDCRAVRHFICCLQHYKYSCTIWEAYLLTKIFYCQPYHDKKLWFYHSQVNSFLMLTSIAWWSILAMYFI